MFDPGLPPSVAVSVVIPTYKHRDWILDTLASVYRQTFTDFEVIIVNDGSTDDTAQVVKQIVAERGIRYFEQTNAGQSRARNFGISQANGEFVALLDDDDLWPVEKLEWQVATLRSCPEAVMAYGGVQLISDVRTEINSDEMYTAQGKPPSGQIREALLRQNRIWSPGQTLIRATALAKTGGLDEAIWGVDDWDLYLRLSELGSIEYRDKLGLRYRKHAGNASQNALRMCSNYRKVVRKHMGRVPWSFRDIRKEQRAFVSNCYSLPLLDQAQDLRSKGKKMESVKACLMAISVRPSLLKSRFFWREHAGPLITGIKFLPKGERGDATR